MADIFLHFLNDITNSSPWWVEPKRPWTYEDLNLSEDWVIDYKDKAGIAKAFLMGHVWKPYGCETPLEFIAGILQKYPDRFVGFHVADPVGGLKAVKEFERAVSEYGFKGLKLFPAYNHAALDDKRIYPLWEKAQELGLPVIVHTGWTQVKGTKIAWQNPVLLDDIAEEFPDLKIVMGHTGFHRADEALMLMWKHINIYGDIGCWHDWPLYRIADVLVLAKGLGLLNRLLWGSDSPFGPPFYCLERYRQLPELTRKLGMEPYLTDEDVNLFLGENARKLVGI